MSQPALTYMLRRKLCPWDAQRIIDETVDWCVEHQVDEIMWITETSAMYKELLPISEIRKIVQTVHTAKQRCDDKGVIHSINPLTTIGHGDFGHDIAARHPGMEMMVDYRGGVSQACACPLSPVWQELMIETFALYAETHPVRLWLEDDWRYLNHGPNVRFGCYCDRHMQAFSAHMGETITREALVEAMLRPGEPHPWRAAWLDFLENLLNDVSVKIREAVHAVSPSTELAWMACNPAAHEAEGRRYGPQMEALAGDGTAAIRMNTTCFHERRIIDMLGTDEALKKAIVQLPGTTTRCTEIETIPHSAYTVSAARIGAQIEWGTILGVPNHTLNIFDYVGTPVSESPLYAPMLRDRKAAFAAFHEAFHALTRFRGIGIPRDPGGIRQTHTDGQEQDMASLLPHETGWSDTLRAFGMPIHYTKNEPITAITGQAVRCMSEAEMEAIFARGVILDASAVQTLEQIGRADLAGVRVKDTVMQRGRPIGPEELTDVDFAGGAHRYTWTFAMGRIAIFEIENGAHPISRIVDADGQPLYHGAVIHDNKLGGRTVCFPYFMQGQGMDPYDKGPSRYFYSPYRRQQMHALVRWLNRGPAPMIVHTHNWVLPHRADGDGRIGLAAMNVNADAWEGVQMTCALDTAPQRIDWLDIDGRRRSLPETAWTHAEGELRLQLDANVPTYRSVAVVLETAR